MAARDLLMPDAAISDALVFVRRSYPLLSNALKRGDTRCAEILGDAEPWAYEIMYCRNCQATRVTRFLGGEPRYTNVDSEDIFLTMHRYHDWCHVPVPVTAMGSDEFAGWMDGQA